MGVLFFLKHEGAGVLVLVLIDHLLMLLPPRVEKESMEGHCCHHDESDEDGVMVFPALQNHYRRRKLLMVEVDSSGRRGYPYVEENDCWKQGYTLRAALHRHSPTHRATKSSKQQQSHLILAVNDQQEASCRRRLQFPFCGHSFEDEAKKDQVSI